MNILVDTNILIDYVCRRGEFYESACKVFATALMSDWKDKEDALQYHAALASNAEAIVTRNPKDFQSSVIPVKLPNDL